MNGLSAIQFVIPNKQRTVISRMQLLKAWLSMVFGYDIYISTLHILRPKGNPVKESW